MGGLRKYMPITYATHADRRDRAARASRPSPASSPRTRSSRRCTSRPTPGAGFAYFCVLGVRVRHRVLHVPADVHDVPRRGQRFDHATPHRRTSRPPVVDGAADPARDSVDAAPAGSDRPTAVRRLLRRSTCAGHDVPRCRTSSRRLGVHRRTASSRCRSGSRSPASRPLAYLYLVRPELPARDRAAASARSTRCSSASTASTSSTRWFFAGGARALGTRLLEGRRRGGDRRLIVNGSARAGRLVRRRDAPAAVGLRLSLRVHDDHRHPRRC